MATAASMHNRRDVRVEIHRRPGFGMAQNVHDDPRMDSLTDEQSGRRVPQVVKPTARELQNDCLPEAVAGFQLRDDS